MSAAAVNLLLVAHACATLIMTGVIWVVQVVHYPLFALVGAERYADYQREHMRRITYIVGPAMVIELATAGAILLVLPEGVPAWMALVGFLLVLVLWLSTAWLQAPAHYRLSRGYDQSVHRLLVGTNWLRTVVWTARGAIAIAMLTLGVAS